MKNCQKYYKCDEKYKHTDIRIKQKVKYNKHKNDI